MFKFVMGPQVLRARQHIIRPQVKAPMSATTASGYYADAVKGIVMAGVAEIMNEVTPLMTELGAVIDEGQAMGQDTSMLEGEEQRLNTYLGDLSRFLF